MKNEEIPVVILAGGLGTRIKEETEYRPKPMVEIGGRPILWHIMKTYSFYGFKNFIICTGFKSEVIQEYFINFHTRGENIKLNLANNHSPEILSSNHVENWTVSIINTGAETNTGGRLLRVKEYINSEVFLLTYGDGLANVNIQKSIDYHIKSNVIATLTAVKQPSRFGLLKIDGDLVSDFIEKPQDDTWINGGFFVFNHKVFDFLSDNSTLEHEPLQTLAKNNQLNAFKHTDFWQPMDTYREYLLLNDLWKKGNAPWKIW